MPEQCLGLIITDAASIAQRTLVSIFPHSQRLRHWIQAEVVGVLHARQHRQIGHRSVTVARPSNTRPSKDTDSPLAIILSVFSRILASNLLTLLAPGEISCIILTE